MKKFLILSLIVIIISTLFGCSSQEFKNLSKEDQEIYLELYEFYQILTKIENGKLPTPLEGKTKERYIYIRDKYYSDEIELNDFQNEIVELFLDIGTSKRRFELGLITDKEKNNEIKESLTKLNAIFEILKSQ